MTPPASDRRRFLLGSSALTLGSLTLGSAAVGANSADDPDLEPVRVAVVGCGSRGSDLIRALTTIDGAALVGICDDYTPHRERGRTLAGPNVPAFEDLAAMLRDSGPTALVIATPLDRHFAMCQAATTAGCAIYCEPLIGQTLAEAVELTRLIARAGTIFQVGFQGRANAIYDQAEAMVAAGMLGSIVAIECRWHRHDDWRRPVPVAKSDPRWAELDRRLNWRLYRASSAGLLAELAGHQLDVAYRLLGGPPRRVVGSGGIDHDRDGREVADNVFCTYDHEVIPPPDQPGPTRTVRVTVSTLLANAYEGASETVLGTKGTLFLTPTKGLFYREATADDPQVIITSGKTQKLANDPWTHRGKPFEIDATGDDTRAALIAFLDNVRRRDPATICPAPTGLLNTATILIGNESIREGRAVTFPEAIAAPAR